MKIIIVDFFSTFRKIALGGFVNQIIKKYDPRYLEVELNASITSAWLLSEKGQHESSLITKKNKSATSGAHLVPIAIPTICRNNFLAKSENCITEKIMESVINILK